MIKNSKTEVVMTEKTSAEAPPDQSNAVQTTVPNSKTVIPTEPKKKASTRTTVYVSHGEHDFKK